MHEVLHIFLLECCYFDIRDSILLAINPDNLGDGCYDGRYGPNNKELTTRKRKREEERASHLGGDLLDFGVTSRLTNPSKKKQIEPPKTGCYPPKKTKNVEEMIQRRVATTRSVHNIMKIRKIVKLSPLKWQFQVMGTTSGKTLYKVDICNTPTCTCPDFQKNGKFVYCKHIKFIITFALRVEDEDKLNAKHIGDEDVKSLLVDNINKWYIKANEPVKLSGSKDYAKLLREYPSFSNEQLCTLQYKKSKTAKCTGWKTVIQPGALCVRVGGALSVLYGKIHVVAQGFYFCPNKQCFATK